MKQPEATTKTIVEYQVIGEFRRLHEHSDDWTPYTSRVLTEQTEAENMRNYMRGQSEVSEWRRVKIMTRTCTATDWRPAG